MLLHAPSALQIRSSFPRTKSPMVSPNAANGTALGAIIPVSMCPGAQQRPGEPLVGVISPAISHRKGDHRCDAVAKLAKRAVKTATRLIRPIFMLDSAYESGAS